MATVETTRGTLSHLTGNPLHKPFRNEPLTNFNNPENARQMREALAKVGAELGQEYDIVIGKQLIKTEKKIKSVNPARPSQVVGIVQEAQHEHVEIAVKSALSAFQRWKYAPVEQRARL